MGTQAGFADACDDRDSSTRGNALLSILSYFMREILCSPFRFARVLSRICLNIPLQISALRLLRIGSLARFVCANPKFLFKHLPPKYLVRDFAASTRTACFVHHYQRLHASLSDEIFERMLEEDLPLFQMCDGQHRFAISIGRARQVANSRQVDHEGEISLNLLVDDAQVFVLSFTIVPGWVVELQAADVLMVTRIQGSLGVFAQISQASKAMHGIPPEMLLLTALQGVGEAFEVRDLAGVSAERHLCYEVKDDAIFKRSYDEFFIKIGAIKNEAGFYSVSLPLQEKPFSQVKRGQKTRTRIRRVFKAEVVNSACRHLASRSPRVERILCAFFSQEGFAANSRDENGGGCAAVGCYPGAGCPRRAQTTQPQSNLRVGDSHDRGMQAEDAFRVLCKDELTLAETEVTQALLHGGDENEHFASEAASENRRSDQPAGWTGSC